MAAVCSQADLAAWLPRLGGEPAQAVERVALRSSRGSARNSASINCSSHSLHAASGRSSGERGARAAQFAEQAIELAQRLDRAAGDTLERQDVVEQPIARHRLPTIRPAYRRSKPNCQRVRIDRCGTGLGLHRRVQPPGHAGATQPAFQRIAAGGVDREASRHCGHVEQVQHVADGEAAFGQIQQLRERAHQRMRARQADIGQVPGDVRRARSRYCAGSPKTAARYGA